MEEKQSTVCKSLNISVGLVCLFSAFLFFSRCHPIGSSKNPELVVADSVVLIDSAKENYNELFDAASTREFYRSREFIPAWSENKVKTVLADSMIRFIQSVRLYGLLPQDYHLQEIETLIDTLQSLHENFRIRRLDVLLTDAFFALSTHLQHGRVDRNGYERVSSSLQDDSLSISWEKLSALNKVIDGHGLKKILEQHEPDFTPYRQLRGALQALIESADSTEKIALYAGQTIDTLEVSARVATIEINLERWRWETEMKDRYILVNIPSFSLNIIEQDSVVLESKIIVGTSRTPTPVLNGIIRSFTLYPYWNVPRDIAINEILPNIKRDSNYLRSHRYEAIDIQGNVLDPTSLSWNKFHKNNFPLMIRQREGTHNALGIIKFSFANKYGVYLHDTNARNLFNKENRALSHGCVRVEKFRELANYLVHDDNVYCSPEDLEQYLQVKKQMIINVVTPLRLYMRYFTCEYRNGALHFYKDVYNLDKPLFEALYPKPSVNVHLAMIQ